MANSAESIVFNAVKALVANGDGTFRCYPDVGPEVVVHPYITYQAVGGQSANYLNNTVNAQRNTRMQVDVWSDDRATASSLIQSVNNALSPPPINATSIGDPVSSYDPATKLYGSRMDFSIWFTP